MLLILLFNTLVLHLDLHFNAAGQFKLHQRVNGLCRRAVDVDEALERCQLELFAGLLVDKSRTVHGKDALVRGQGDRTAYHCASALHCAHDLLGRLVNQVVIVAFQFNSNLLAHIINNVSCIIVNIRRDPCTR